MADRGAGIRSAVPGVVRVVATSSWRMVSWAVDTTTSTAGLVARSVLSGDPPAQVVEEITSVLRSVAQGVLGLSDSAGSAGSGRVHGASVAELRARGAELLTRSADVWYANDTHPAYARILDELEPDEARMLRFLAIEGAQPSVDIRTNRPLGIGSELVESGLSMIGLQAGARKLARTRADLNNLYRLGLIWFSREEVKDPTRYQVVEVQPDVLEAIKKAGRSPRIVRRSIHLTPFGEDFCRTCFSLEGMDGAGAAPAPALGPGLEPRM